MTIKAFSKKGKRIPYFVGLLVAGPAIFVAVMVALILSAAIILGAICGCLNVTPD